MNGTVKEYDKTKGFGFISGDDGEDYYLLFINVLFNHNIKLQNQKSNTINKR